MAKDLEGPIALDAETLASKSKMKAVLDEYKTFPTINLRMYSRLKAIYEALEDDPKDH